MDTGHVCIKPWNLIPEKYFRFHSPTPFSCSYLTTVPVWCYFADGLLEQLDQYIDALTQIIPGKKLQITSGTLGTLALLQREINPKKKILSASLDLLSRITDTEPEKPKPPEGIYLAKTKKKIPIPASIYKLIEFKSSICPDDHRQCWYSIIIELRNAPYTLITTTENHICKKSKCFDWGWDLLHREGHTRLDDFLFFCCERTPEIKEKLNLPAHDERKPRYEMNLKRIPYINEKGEIGIKSLRDEVNQRLLKLDKVGSGKSQETDTSKKENELVKLDEVESGKSQETDTPEKENELLKLSKVESGKSQEADASKKEDEQ
ncbi:uncharacterized protein LOC135841110 [Planococcus citri]|uniref:uncharacterized protein LOC135841110 n=1 Tax=Planococcus citri TaxID=170843 RepID=UPI0031F7F7B1